MCSFAVQTVQRISVSMFSAREAEIGPIQLHQTVQSAELGKRDWG